jgi:hypothetical protein
MTEFGFSFYFLLSVLIVMIHLLLFEVDDWVIPANAAPSVSMSTFIISHQLMRGWMAESLIAAKNF